VEAMNFRWRRHGNSSKTKVQQKGHELLLIRNRKLGPWCKCLRFCGGCVKRQRDQGRVALHSPCQGL
jgi:hypothetical protein